MHIETYNPVTGNSVANPARDLNFGGVVQGQHNPSPIVIRVVPDNEVTVSNLKMFLESKGGWSEAEFGYYTNPAFVPSIESGGSELSNHFTESPNATETSPGDVPIGVTGNISDYIWLDIDVPFSQTGIAEPNYRFTFDFT